MLLPTPPATPWQGTSSAHNFQLLIFNFQFTCQGVAKGVWMWIIVHETCYNSQILNCQLWFVNCQLVFLPRGRWEIFIERDLFNGIITNIQWNHYKHAMESVHACTVRNARLRQIHQSLLIKLSEPFVRKNLFVWFSLCRFKALYRNRLSGYPCI